VLYLYGNYKHKFTIEEVIADTKAEYLKNKKKRTEKEKKKEVVELLNEEEKSVQFDNTIFSNDIYDALKEGGFIDTTNSILKDKANILGLEASIKGVEFYRITPKSSLNWDHFIRTNAKIDWLLKNTYGEVLDSIRMETFSGDFSASYALKEDETIYAVALNDAVANSLHDLFDNSRMDSQLKRINPDKFENLTPLTINKPASPVNNAKSALKASVIVKHKDNKSHGSGFTISEDGYILTNYHVIAGKVPEEYSDFVIVTADGTEHEAKVVRTNVNKDIALLKVEANFDNAFELKSEKTFDLLDNVFTIGTPKSLDLGQTISTGVLSNERKKEGVNIIQLSMSVNSGNSGGPLFTEDGTLHGVVTSKLMGYGVEGVSFALPSYLISKYLSLEVK